MTAPSPSLPGARAPLTSSSLFDALIEHAPDFGAVRDEHLTFYEELLSHVLMADLTRWVVRSFHPDRELSPSLRAVLDLLEQGISSPDEDLSNVVGVSFVENLLDEPDLPSLRLHLGPGLQHQLQLFESWTP